MMKFFRAIQIKCGNLASKFGFLELGRALYPADLRESMEITDNIMASSSRILGLFSIRNPAQYQLIKETEKKFGQVMANFPELHRHLLATMGPEAAFALTIGDSFHFIGFLFDMDTDEERYQGFSLVIEQFADTSVKLEAVVLFFGSLEETLREHNLVECRGIGFYFPDDTDPWLVETILSHRFATGLMTTGEMTESLQQIRLRFGQTMRDIAAVKGKTCQ